jgi:glycosyltransferase involved in cell wall biosynthesis
LNEPLVSVVIPTYNSEKTLVKCLESIKNQTYKNVEIIIVDSYSRDKTVEVAKSFGVKVLQTDWKLLGARYLGFKKSVGDIILLLDSDQILEKTAIKRAVKLLNDGYDMLCLEEHTFEPKGWIPRLFEADRKLTHKFADVHLNPLEGVLMARIYKREILDIAFKRIPKTLFRIVVAHDHAIIYYEVYKVSQKVGIVSNAIWHIEPNNLWVLIKKNYRYGKSTHELVKTGYYKELLRRKIRFRKSAFKDWKLGLQSHLLLLLKGIGYYTGYFSAELVFLMSKIIKVKFS